MHSNLRYSFFPYFLSAIQEKIQSTTWRRRLRIQKCQDWCVSRLRLLRTTFFASNYCCKFSKPFFLAHRRQLRGWNCERCMDKTSRHPKNIYFLRDWKWGKTFNNWQTNWRSPKPRQRCMVSIVLDHQTMAKYLAISVESFERIKGEIMSSNDRRLHTVRDNLEEFSYNQIRFVLACQIQDQDL